jgi:hypothetical protein
MSRRYITVAEQTQIIERADGRCEYCQSFMEYSSQSFAIEHILPVALGVSGQATVDTLRMNRAGVINIRRLLLMIVRHPPS